MSNKAWKREERQAAALFGGKRFPANIGGPLDFETSRVVGQVKHVNRLSLSELERLALAVAEIGTDKGKDGLLVVKRRGGRGITTPRLVVMTERVLAALMKISLPADPIQERSPSSMDWGQEAGDGR